MTYVRDRFESLPRLPSWVASGQAETPEDFAFLSGAALSHLHLLMAHEGIPHALLRARLALKAAEACTTLAGRPERTKELRDTVGFLRPGDSPGPAGEIYLSWQRAIDRPVSTKVLYRALPEIEAEQIATWLDMAWGGPVQRIATLLQAVLEEPRRDHRSALLLADATLAQALGWTHVLPLLAIGLKRGELRMTGKDLRLACHRALVASGAEATREAIDLTRRAERLRAIAPKLRAKGAEAAVALFLARDAVAPTALTSLRSNRAARRFCDRLVELGAVHELTGRDTFRLYGI